MPFRDVLAWMERAGSGAARPAAGAAAGDRFRRLIGAHGVSRRQPPTYAARCSPVSVGLPGDQVGDRSLVEDLAAVSTGAGAEVDDPVRVPDDVEVVFDDDNGLALVDELVE